MSVNKNESGQIAVIALAVFILFCLGTVIFLYYQNQQLKNMLAKYSGPTTFPTPLTTSIPVPAPTVIVTSPIKSTKIVSPLTVTGSVPPGWMFEGIFPIKLIDSNKKVIAQGNAKETVAGSWQGGSSVDFKATLTFSNFKGTGTLVLENDNPSGDPNKVQVFEVPIGINCLPRPACLDANPRCMIPETSDMCPAKTTTLPVACTMEAKICPDGSSVGRTGPNCEFTPCPTN